MSTIFALATANAKSGVAIIRVSGDNSYDVIKHFHIKNDITPRKAILANILHPETKEIIDSGLLLWFPGSNSFTGEDTVELQVHGSRAVINDLLVNLSDIPNFRLAEPGEFSRRAFENGKMDLTQAEGLADLIDAETSLQRKHAVRQMGGALGELYSQWRQELIDIMAFIEAYIDFPDEDIPSDIVENTYGRIKKLREDISAHLNDSRKGERLKQGLHTVIIGAPNAGKSSLINKLAQREVAIVTDQAGTTRDMIEIHLDIEGYPITLIDTAGIRDHSSDAIENEGIRRALNMAENADVKILLFDGCKLPEIDIKTRDLIDNDSIVCISKSDMLEQNIPFNIDGHDVVIISMMTEVGIIPLVDRLTDIAKDSFALSSSPMITRTRYRNLLNECMECLDRFSLEQDLLLVSEDLRFAANALGKITGNINVEDILDSLFSNFCIGK